MEKKTEQGNSNVSPSILADKWRGEENELKRLETNMTYLFAGREIPAVLRSVIGRPGELIYRIAIEENAAMIILGSHSSNKVWRSLVGSVTNSVLRRADCSVVICRDPVCVERLRQIACVDGESKKVRRRSGESITSRIRHRFASGSQCLPSRDDSERLFLGEWEEGGDRAGEMRI